MKIAILGDTHWGARGDSEAFREHFNKFYKEIFFPYLRDNNIDTVIQMGDMMDRRKFVNFRTLFLMKENFIKPFEDGEFKLHVIVGNHDTYFRNTNEVNSINELFQGIDNVSIYPQMKEVMIGGKNFLMMPWINKENEERSLEALKTSTANVLIGHLEVDGFEMHKGTPNFGGMKPELFRRFDYVFSGHYHHRSSSGNITYVGTPYEMTWSDHNDTKGFHIFDMDSEKLTFVKNPYQMHHKIFYNDEEEQYEGFPVKLYEDSIVKIIVVNKTKVDVFERLVERFNQVNLVDFQITDATLAYRDCDIEDIEVEDTLSTLHKHIELLENEDIDKSVLKDHIQEIYAEAISIGRDQ